MTGRNEYYLNVKYFYVSSGSAQYLFKSFLNAFALKRGITEQIRDYFVFIACVVWLNERYVPE